MRTKKRILAMIMSVVLMMTMMTGFAAAEGTEYTVGTAEELAALVLDYEESATLTFTADIDMSDVEFDGLGYVTNLTVVGNGYTVSGLTAPLFSELSNCSVSGLNIEAEFSGEDMYVDRAGALAGYLYGTDVDSCNIVLDCDITNSDLYLFGGLAGYADSCEITNCYVSGTWNFESYSEVDYTGGLIGDVDSYMNISNCITDVDMNFDEALYIFDIGGLLGGIEGFDNYIDTCYTLGDITISNLPDDFNYYSNDYYCIGGFSGWTESATYTNCGVFGDIINNTDGGRCVGGFIGEIYGETWFYNCFTTSDASGNRYVGGFIGACWNTNYTADTFVNCYSSGKVVASQEEYGNAFAGYTDIEDVFIDCYTNVTEGIGLYNYNYDVITESENVSALIPDDAASMEELEGSLNEFVEAFTGDLELYDWILENSKGTPVHKGISFEIAVVDETGETVATETVYLGQDLSDYDFESLVPEKEGYTVEMVTDVASLTLDFVNADIEIEVEYTEIPEVTPEVTPEATPEVTPEDAEPEATPEDADPTQPDTGDNGIVALVGLMLLAGAGVAAASKKRA